MIKIKDLTDKNITHHPKNTTMLYYFYTPTCSSCKMLGDILRTVAKEASPGVAILKTDISKNKLVATKFHITTTPTVLIKKNNQWTDSFSGVRTKDYILSLLKK